MSSRKEQKARLKQERLARERDAAEAARRKRLLARAAAVVVAVAALAGLVVAVVAGAGGSGGGSDDFPAGSVPPQRIAGLERSAEAAGCTLQELESEGASHVEQEVTYRSKPPHSGNHSPRPADDGAYAKSPGTARIVHSLEHGRVAFWFRPDAPAVVKGKLKAVYDEDSYHVVLAADETGMPTPVAASAWTRVISCPEVNDRTWDALRAFKDEYRDQGPEFVP